MDYYGRLCALRIPVWSEAVRKEAMGPFISWGICWSQRKKRYMRFWQNMEGLSKYRAMLVKMDCGIKTQHNTQTTFSCIFSWNPNGTNKNVPLLQYVSVQWFLYEPSYSFFLCAAGSFCLWWKLLTWPTCWNRREISPCSPQATRLLLVWPRVIWPCWRVGLPDSFHLLTCFNHRCYDLIVTQKINK